MLSPKEIEAINLLASRGVKQLRCSANFYVRFARHVATEMEKCAVFCGSPIDQGWLDILKLDDETLLRERRGDAVMIWGLSVRLRGKHRPPCAKCGKC